MWENTDPKQAILPSSTSKHTNPTENYFLSTDLSAQSANQFQ